MSSKTKRYASLASPTMEAVANRLYRFSSRDEALAQLQLLRSHFVTSATPASGETDPSVQLWVKAFSVTDEDKAKGIIGHFARISLLEIDGKWTLMAEKLDMPVTQHPQRAQVKRDNPNWGHPVMRSIRKAKPYPTLEAAQAELDLLHSQFSRVSIPNLSKLYIMVYCVDRPAKQRMVKHILSIKLQPDATYLIECKENIPKDQRLPKAKKSETPVSKGYFAAKVSLRRHTKGKSHNPTKPANDSNA